MRKINLLYVITRLELGGAQKHLLSLISLLDKERFNVFLFTGSKGLLLNEALSLNGLKVVKSTCLERSINPLKDFLALIEIQRFIKRNNIDIVHTHSSKAGILGRFAAGLANVKIIVHTVHGWSFNDYQPLLLRLIFVWLEKIAAYFTHKIIVVSDYDRQKGLSNHIGNNDKYALIRYGLNYAQFNISGKNIRKTLGIGPDELVVGTVSCLKPQKSPQDFVKLVFLVSKRMPDVKFILSGDGILRERVEKLIDSFGLRSNLLLLGWRTDIPEILGALDVFVLASLWEGLPISVLEAMAASRAVVATDTGGIKEVIKEGKTGYLVAPGDIQGMSAKLIALLKDNALRETVGRNAKESLSFDFTLSNLVNNIRDLYEDLLSTRCKNY